MDGAVPVATWKLGGGVDRRFGTVGADSRPLVESGTIWAR